MALRVLTWITCQDLCDVTSAGKPLKSHNCFYFIFFYSKSQTSGVILPSCTCYRWSPDIWCQIARYLYQLWHSCEEEASYLKQRHLRSHSRMCSFSLQTQEAVQCTGSLGSSSFTRSNQHFLWITYLWSSQIRPVGRLHRPTEGAATSVATPAGRSGYGPGTESPHRTLKGKIKLKRWVTGGKCSLLKVDGSSLRRSDRFRATCSWNVEGQEVPVLPT